MTLGKIFLAAVLYAAVASGANPVLADAADSAALQALRAGDMRKMAIHATPVPASTRAFENAAGDPVTLADYRGRTVLVNFWATWCAPCRAEMAKLEALQAELGGADFQVVTIATGPNPLPAIRKFFAEENITHLPVLRDPKSALARDMGVLGLPATVLLNPDGAEVARMVGDADWHSPEAVAFLRAATAMHKDGGAG